MPKIILISGACGCGKTTFADAYARHLVRQEHKTVYLIHGDDFHHGFIEPEDKGDFFIDGQASDQVLWEDILHFNWDCIIATAGRALRQGMDAVIDYVVEDELPRVKELAEDCVMACLDNKGGKWQQAILIFNCSGRSGYAQLPAGTWQILADGEDSFRWQQDSAVTEKIKVSQWSAMILGLK